MSTATNQSTLHQALTAFNTGDLDTFASLLTPNFFDYTPQPGEPSAPESFRHIARDLRAAFPDLTVTLDDLTPDGDHLRGRMTLAGTYTGSLWGVPGDNAPHTATATVIARFEDGRLALRWEDLNYIGLLRELRAAPTPDQAHLKPPHQLTIPEIILRLAWNGLRLQEKPCSHLHLIQVRDSTQNVCNECVATGDQWPALRLCLVCGYVGCCDMSVNKHMKKHAEETGHPLIRSLVPGESWLWCYPDSAFLGARHLNANT